MSLTNKVEQFNENSDLIDRWVNGDKHTEIQTAGGRVPSVAKLADGIQTKLSETIEQQRVLEQRLSANTGAGLVKTSSGKTVQEELGGRANVNGSSSNDFYARNFQTGGANTLTIAGGAVAGAAPQLTTAGIGADINVELVTKGGGRTAFRNAAGYHLYVGGYSAAQVMANLLRIYGGPTGANPTVYGEGSDLNVGIDFTAKGAGEFVYRSNGGLQFAVGNNASTVNYLRVVGGAANGSPNLNAQGNDANISIVIQPKGAGQVLLAPNGSISFAVASVTGAVNYVQASGAVAGSAPVLAAVGVSPNIDLNLLAKGTGVIRAGSDFRTLNNIIIDASTSERRLQFNTASGTLAYLFARNADGVVGLYDATGGNNVTAWAYAPSTKSLGLGGGAVTVTAPDPVGQLGVVNLRTMQAAIAAIPPQTGGGWVVLADVTIPTAGPFPASLDWPTIFADNPTISDFVVQVDGVAFSDSIPSTGVSGGLFARFSPDGVNFTSTIGYYHHVAGMSGVMSGTTSIPMFTNAYAGSARLLVCNVQTSTTVTIPNSVSQYQTLKRYTVEGSNLSTPGTSNSAGSAWCLTGLLNPAMGRSALTGVQLLPTNNALRLCAGRYRIFGIKP